MKGLRTPENGKFVNFFKKVQNEAGKSNKTFFLDTGDCKDVEFEDMELDRLFGWLIPNDLESVFEKDFIGRKVGTNWDDFYMSLDFDVSSGNLKLWFE